MDIGIQISNLRKQKKWTQAKLAKELNISAQSVSKWEKGESTPAIDLLIKIAKLFNVTLDEFVSLTQKTQVDLESLNKKLELIFELSLKKVNYLPSINALLKTLFLIKKNEDPTWKQIAKDVVKATIISMIEAKTTKENFSIDYIKNLLLADYDEKDKIEKLKIYFSSKSKKIQKLVSIFYSKATQTIKSLLEVVYNGLNV